ncbi:hypothetical protein BG000_006167 [Podila horticola]|nr:hypothetical protein BG000_006167 [Podila horticola]
MFDRFQLFGEDFPNFIDLREWSTIKLLRSMDRSKSATVNAVRFTMYAAFNAIEVHNSEQNQKNIAIRELSDLGVDISGPMVMGDTPLGVSALAGFHNEPYELCRDVIPPLELQRQIFPMIESQHGDMDPAQWKAHCDRVMMDPLALPVSSSKPGEARTRRVAAAQVSKDAYLELTRKNFLTLLLWFRRIILQDGALFIRDGALNGCVSHAVFSTQEFEQFKTHLLKKMAKGQVPMPSQDRGSASNSHSAVQHDQKSSGTSSSRARSTRRGRERRRTGSRQRLLDEQSQEADKLPNNVLTDSNQDLHEADLDDNLAAGQDLQQWIDQDCKRQKQAHGSLSDLLRREQEQKQKSREREIYRVQQNIEKERADVERRLGRLEQRYVQQSEDFQSLRRQMVQQDKNIQRLGAAHELKLQQFEVELATQADQIALQEERFQLLEEERDDWKQEQRKKTQRGLDQRTIERQLPDSPSFGGRGSSRQIGRETGVATGLRAVPK